MFKKVDIIISCFNEEANILPFYNEAKKYLKDKKYRYNLVFVNDGSVDNTYNEIQKVVKKSKALKNVKVSYITFKHNFGHEAAMCAGFDVSKADYLIVMDVDLQNPPKKIPEIMKKFEKGYDCVLLRRVKYKSATFMKRFTSNAYYLFSKIVLRNKNARNVSDFFAVNKELAKNVKNKYKTRLRFIRSFVQSEAKNIAFVNYDNEKRFAGVSRYNYTKLTKLALVSELSRNKFLRDRYSVTKEKPVYIVDGKKTKYV